MILAAAWEAVVGWSALLLGATMSFLFSGLETGLYGVNKIRLELLGESGSRPAQRLLRILHDPREPLSVLLLGNNMANYLASFGMVLLLEAAQVARADWVSVAVLTPLIFTFCEVLPKNLFHRHSEALTYRLSWFLGLWRWLFKATGLVAVIRLIVTGAIRLAGRRLGPTETPLSGGRRIAAILAEGRASGVLTETQSLIAERVVNIASVRLKDVCVPLASAVLIEESAVTPEALRELLVRHGHPRIGVYRQRRENIVGLINVYDVLLEAPEAEPASLASEPIMMSEQLGVAPALVRLQQARQSAAFVADAAGRCTGMVTVKDLVEEIVGELKEW